MAAPKGHPRWGGRKAGTPNKANLEVRNRIEAEGDPVGFLIKVVKGHKIRGEHPSVDQRIRAAERLMAKVAPDLKGVEMIVDSEVEATISHDAHDKLLKLIDGKVKSGIFEGLKRSGLERSGKRPSQVWRGVKVFFRSIELAPRRLRLAAIQNEARCLALPAGRRLDKL